MFPISDDNPRAIVPVVTWTILGICVAVYLFQITLPRQGLLEFLYSFGTVPAELLGTGKSAGQAFFVPGPPEMVTLITSMFLHGGFLHIAGNMLYLWIFADNVEAAMGWFRFVIFYLVCGVVATLAHALAEPSSVVPMVGASGAISGVLGAYLLLYPRATVRVLIFFIPIVQVIRVSALVVLGLYFLMQIIFAMMADPNEAGGVAFWAHVGGFLAGMALIPIMKYRHIPLYKDRFRRGPWG